MDQVFHNHFKFLLSYSLGTQCERIRITIFIVKAQRPLDISVYIVISGYVLPKILRIDFLMITNEANESGQKVTLKNNMNKLNNFNMK